MNQNKLSSQFAQLLKQVQYPEADLLSQDSLDWVFAEHGYSSAASTPHFLEWMTKNMKKRNYVSQEQLHEVERLQREGKYIEDEDELDRLLKQRDIQIEDEEDSLELLQNQLFELSEELQEVETRAKRKMMQKQLLLQDLQENKKSKLDSILRDETLRLSQTKLQLETNINDELNQTLQSLNSVVKSTLQLFQSIDKNENMLSHFNLQEYLEQDKEFTKLLANYSQQQLSSQQLDFDANLKELIQATKTLSVEEQQQHSLELERLKSAFYVSEQHYLASLIELTKMNAKVSFTKQFDWNSAHSKSYEQLSAICIKLETELQTCKEHLRQKLSIMIEMIKEITEGESAVTLDCSYDIKLAKQDYFMMKQDKIIEFLAGQRGRHELLKAALQTEENRFTYCIHILEAIQREISIRLKEVEERVTQYKHSNKSGNDAHSLQMPTLIESNDFLGQSIHQVIAPQDTESLYLSFVCFSKF